MQVPKPLRPLKTEFYLWRKAIRQGRFWSYIYSAYGLAPRIRRRTQPIDRPVTHPELTVHMLLCHRDLTMALWSLASYYAVTSVTGQLMIHSDGTLTEADRALIARLLPNAVVVTPDEADAAVRAADIPEAVREFRLTQPVVYLKKLVDTSVLAKTPYHLLIDSDLAWFRVPEEIEHAVRAGERCARMTLNSRHCPVYIKGDRELPEEYSQYNGGIIFFHEDAIDLAKLIEFFDLLDMEKKQLFIGQSGHAYCLSHLEPLAYERYPMRGEITEQTVMMHYSQPRRVRFYTDALPILKDRLNSSERYHDR